MKILCKVFGHPRSQYHKRYLLDKTTGYCPICNPRRSFRKGYYDLKILGSNKCPNCGIELKHLKRFMGYHCNTCEQNF